nr:MAG TPA: hypothetical protein [Caudoviricetes sp.]
MQIIRFSPILLNTGTAMPSFMKGVSPCLKST